MFRLDPSRLPRTPVTRFAPSPTGLLHLGHVANAVWTWGIAQAVSGRVLLRIEDHDRGRCRPEYERAILEDLAWLGLIPDDHADAFVRQSDRGTLYRDAAHRLGSRAQVYACRCSRRDLARAHGLRQAPGGDELPYPGTCRSLGLAQGSDRGMRLALPQGAMTFTDLRHGPVTQRPADQCGDLLLRDRNGNWTYQFCVVVDDLDQGVNLVIRGDDLLPSTGRQILLGAMLGRPSPPVFLHHPLVMSHGGDAKLSKRDGAAGLAELRHAGFTREALLGEAAYRTGLIPARRDVDPAEVGRLFV